MEMIGRLTFALFVALFAISQLPCTWAQKQFALTDKIGQGNFAFEGQPGYYYGDDSKLLYRLASKRAQRFAYENDSPFSGKFAKMVPGNQRDFAFAFAKRAQ